MCSLALMVMVVSSTFLTIVIAGKDSRSEQRDAADCLPAVPWQERERHSTDCTGDAGGSPASDHGQHDC